MYIKLTQEEFPKNLFKFHSKIMSDICTLSSIGRKDQLLKALIFVYTFENWREENNLWEQ